ncbi:hypothetical protein FF2_034007 [Malus domestica]
MHHFQFFFHASLISLRHQNDLSASAERMMVTEPGEVRMAVLGFRHVEDVGVVGQFGENYRDGDSEGCITAKSA